MIGVYIHIPYCRTRCPYCDFVREPIAGAVPAVYTEALCREIAAAAPAEASSIFFGGGTPSLLAPGDLARVLDTLAGRFTLNAPEVTIEANPDDVTEGLARAWRDTGVNRVSLGVQSFNDDVLRYLGRRHDAETARRACETISAAFDNWSMDLIFGARPDQAWRETLATCLALSPPHVSAYGLTYEPGTPFEKRAQDRLDEDTVLALYQEAEETLRDLDHYEISNFARPGRRARHNLIYWHNEEYAGFGTGAYSFLGGVRARNHADTRQYLAAPGNKAEAVTLTEREIRVETLIQHFRLRDGLEKRHYAARFGCDPRADFGPALDSLLARGLIEEDAAFFRPTREGFYLNNEIGLALV